MMHEARGEMITPGYDRPTAYAAYIRWRGGATSDQVLTGNKGDAEEHFNALSRRRTPEPAEAVLVFGCQVLQRFTLDANLPREREATRLRIYGEAAT